MKKRRLDDLPLEDVIDRSLVFCESDVDPLIRYLAYEEPENWKGLHSKEKAKQLSDCLRKMGSNDIATFFRGEGVPYDEVVYDVGRKLSAYVNRTNSAAENENAILIKVFKDSLDKMSDEEKRILFKSMNMNQKEIPYGATSTMMVQFLLKRYGGFAVYRLSLIISNMVARALLGRGLSLAANAMLARGISVFLGPIGWIATGAWLLVDLAGPAFRKTVPSVLHIAYLRQMLLNRVTIGVVGDGSTGKDSLLKCVFRLDTGNIDPVAGSTTTTLAYYLDEAQTVSLVNYPGFNDFRPEVDSFTNDYFIHSDVFLMVMDVARGVSKVDIEIYQKVKKFGRPVLVCLNKIDVPKPQDLRKLIKAAKDRISAGRKDFVECCFDPDPRHQVSPCGSAGVLEWVCERLLEYGKSAEALKGICREEGISTLS
jgi:uncharacterized protein YaaW (UPF0174 family)/signal recognition particle receptor subunit beta